MSEKSDLEKCKEERMSEYERYYETVLLTLGIRDYLGNYGGVCRFVSAEPRFHDLEGNELTPDIVLQYEKNQEGALCEVKTSLPIPDGYLLKKLMRLEKYSKEAIGWDTPSRKVVNHDVILFCHALDSDRIIPKLKKWIDEGKIKISKKLCICEWSMISSTKTARDVILVRHRYGETNCEKLTAFLKENIVIDVQKLAIEIENCKFTRKEPPVEYTMVELWMNVFSSINSKFENFEVSIEELLRKTYEYYIPWSNIGNEYSQVRETWIKKAMSSFCKIGIAEQNDKEKNTFKVLRSKKIPKKTLEYFVESLCRQSIVTKIKKPQIQDIELRYQKKLRDF